MRKLILTSAVILSTALGATSFALADKTSGAERHGDMCTNISARQIGNLAELEAKLKPTAAQTAKWSAYKQIKTDQAAASEKSCTDRVAARKAYKAENKRPTIIERQAMMEKGLEAKLADLRATTPVLTDLYASLSDEQKQVLDKEGFRHGGEGHGDSKHKASFKHHSDEAATPEAPVEQ
ncbi:MAG: Spy/CpxP family protein refolding chaperone [Pseudomonadota bacterium]